jgi:phage/plasmid-associated DNA primase
MVKAKDLYDLYKKWCRNYGNREMSAKWFNAEIVAHVGWYKEVTTIKGYKTYKGIKVKEV